MAPSDQWRQEGESLVRGLEFDDFKADNHRAMAETIDGVV